MKSRKQQNISPAKAAKAPGSHPPAIRDNPNLIAGICVALAIIVWMVFGQTSEFSFVNFDDDIDVYQNSAVIHGLTPGDVALAFSCHATDSPSSPSNYGTWYPLTRLSHMLDWQFYGANAGGHHVTNVVLHAITAILLFLVLYKMTAAMWRSAFVAAVFAIHPLRAESVAWVTGRKDVLSGLFFMLTLWAYLGYVRHPRSLSRYLLTLFLAALGLMSKPILVTLPFILLLLDYWPLKRWGAKPRGPGPESAVQNPPAASETSVLRLIAEKVPFLLLSLATFIPGILAGHPGSGASEKFPFILRIENALVSYVAYIRQLFYPAKLAVLYPFPKQGLPLLEVAGALTLLIIVSLAVLYLWRKRPYLLVGWLWYLIMLGPAIGLLQVGEHARADRFTYLSQIGLCVLLTWLVADLSLRLRHRFAVLASLSSVILAALIYCSQAQTSYWQNSETLWTHTLACTSANPTAHFNLGYAFAADGRPDDAIDQYQQALKIDPHFSRASYNLGNALLRQGQLDDAITQYQEALKFDQGHAAAADCDNMGTAFFRKGQTADAIVQFQKALKFDPEDVSAYDNLGKAFRQEGRLEEAIAPYQEALKLQPDNVDFQSNLAVTIWMSTKSPRANETNVLEAAQSANQITGGNNPFMLRALAAAYARCGRFPDAIETGKRALALATESQPEDFINTLQQEIALYQTNTPLPIVNQTNTMEQQ